MPKTRAEIKARIMAELEAVVDQVVTQVEQGEGLTITGIEDMVLQARNQIGQQLTG
jgi:hypothetical protein